MEGVKVVAAYDIDAARVAAAREAGLRGYDKLDDFLRDEEINLVLVATPNDSHCDLVCAALAAGKHVISEKPPAMSLAELDKMIATAEAHGRIFTVHQNRRWDIGFPHCQGRAGNRANWAMCTPSAPRCTARAARCSAGARSRNTAAA